MICADVLRAYVLVALMFLDCCDENKAEEVLVKTHNIGVFK